MTIREYEISKMTEADWSIVDKLRAYLQNGGGVYTLNELREMTPAEVAENWEKVSMSLSAIVYEDLL